MLHLGLSTVHRTRQRFVDDGLTAALSEQSRSGSPPTLTGKQAAFLVALACSTPPAGRHRWTLKLLLARPGQPTRYDYEYKREGTANLFRFAQPFAVGVTSILPRSGPNRISLSKCACWSFTTSRPPNGFG
ncbi:MAG: helix-turn-helix domain-containing protein [Candidatus Competibacter sp.]|nr:helix-turn-helix domain-containing protein [Candidatus Competibacter sp.]